MLVMNWTYKAIHGSLAQVKKYYLRLQQFHVLILKHIHSMSSPQSPSHCHAHVVFHPQSCSFAMPLKPRIIGERGSWILQDPFNDVNLNICSMYIMLVQTQKLLVRMKHLNALTAVAQLFSLVGMRPRQTRSATPWEENIYVESITT